MRYNSLLYIFLAYVLLSVGLQSCKFEEENIFSDSPAIRTEKTLAEYKDLLCDDPNGWVMQYFPTDTTEGFTFTMKFLKSGQVQMAAKNRWIKDTYTTDSCTFDLIADNGPVLSFPTAGSYVLNGEKIGIFHLFSNPIDPKGTSNYLGSGLEGDYEFVVMSASKDSIMLQGKKRKTNILMKKMSESVTWKDYFAKIDAMKTKLYQNNLGRFKIVYGDGSTYTLQSDIKSYGSYASKFKIYPAGSDSITTGVDYAYIITPEGLKFHTPYVSNGKSAQTFVLADDQSKLNCIDAASNNAYLTNQHPGTDFIPDYMTTSKGWAVNLSNLDATMTAHLAQANASLVTIGGTKSGITALKFKFDKTRNSYVLVLSYKLSGTVSTESFDFSFVSSNNQLTLSYKGTQTSGGTVLLQKVAGLSDLVNDLSGTYSIESAIALINPTLGIKFVKSSSSSNWLYLTGGTL